MSKTIQRKTLFTVTIALVAGAANTAPVSNTHDLSQQCGELVAGLYKEAWPKAAVDDGGARAKFAGHYNTKLGKCFLLETVAGASRSPALRRILPRETQRLSDANEKREYGKYDSWGDGPPATCWLQEKMCSSRQEWVQLIKPFMEE